MQVSDTFEGAVQVSSSRIKRAIQIYELCDQGLWSYKQYMNDIIAKDPRGEAVIREKYWPTIMHNQEHWFWALREEYVSPEDYERFRALDSSLEEGNLCTQLATLCQLGKSVHISYKQAKFVLEWDIKGVSSVGWGNK